MTEKKLNTGDELFKQIGIMSSDFAAIEVELINAFGLLIDDNYLEVGEIIADSLSYSQTIDLFEKLAKFRLEDETALEKLQILCPKLKKAAKARNNIIHSSFSFSHPDGKKVYQNKVRKKHIRKKNSGYISSPEEVSEIINFMNDLFQELQEFETDYL